jgi:subtilase family serine protease
VLISVAAPRPDLIVSTVTDSNNQARQGDKVTFTATITNIGRQSARASKTQFLLDGSKVIGLIDTPAVGAGQSVQVSVNWLTASVPKGQHTIKTTADKTGLVTESDEGNNTKTITVAIQGNKT